MRHVRGLPGTSLHWGIVAEVGMAATVPNEAMSTIGIRRLSPGSVALFLGACLRDVFGTEVIVDAKSDWT